MTPMFRSARGAVRRSWFPVVVAVSIALFTLGVAAGTAAEASPAVTAPTLGVAAPFAVLAHTTVTNTGSTVVSGDLGVFPAQAVTGFVTSTTKGAGTVVNGKQYRGTTTFAGPAQAALSVAYTAAMHAPQTKTKTVTTTNLSGLKLSAGVYTSTSGLALTGTLTLTGSASSVFIFQAVSTLITGTGSSIVLDGGVQACNIFWQVGSSATLKTGSKFFGTVMALDSASLTKTVTVTGRILVKTGAVTLLTDHVTESACKTSTTTTTTSTTPTSAPSTPPTSAPSTVVTTHTTPTSAPSTVATSHTTPTTAPANTVTPVVVPTVHTGEPWAGWFYWLIVAAVGAVGFGLLADRLRRRHLRRS
ncbi:MAG: ice-binding family protein [Acidimicrobiales bacterium]